MHFSFWEKAGFAVLVAAWVIWGSDKVGDILVHADELQENVFKIEVADSGETNAASSEPADAGPDTMTLLASLSAADGEKVFRKCAGCHTVAKGEANKVGPNLFNVVGAKHGHRDDFAYSDGMKGKPGDWTYQSLDEFLLNPRGYISGTKMSFNGLSKASDRAAVILYLREYTDNPPPLP